MTSYDQTTESPGIRRKVAQHPRNASFSESAMQPLFFRNPCRSAALTAILVFLPTACQDSASALAADASDSNGRPRSNDGSTFRRPVLAPDDVVDNAELSWRNEFGPGGAFIPQLPSVELTRTPTVAFTRLLGVVFPRGTHDVLFLGITEPGQATLSPDELLDAFVIAFRAAAVGKSPGMSIDPTPEQLGRQLREGDVMDVVYFGNLRGTEFGRAAFECDRLMKCLSFGKDNVTKQPVECQVPGYQSELELIENLPTRDRPES